MRINMIGHGARPSLPLCGWRQKKKKERSISGKQHSPLHWTWDDATATCGRCGFSYKILPPLEYSLQAEREKETLHLSALSNHNKYFTISRDAFNVISKSPETRARILFPLNSVYQLKRLSKFNIQVRPNNCQSDCVKWPPHLLLVSNQVNQVSGTKPLRAFAISSCTGRFQR